MMRVYISVLIIYLLFLPLLASGQNISLSGRIDSLVEQLGQHPNSRLLTLRLIDEYIQLNNPELALLEVLDAENNGVLGADDAYLKGEIEFNLEQIDAAERTVIFAYLENPSDDLLLRLAVLSYAKGSDARGRRILKRIENRSTDVTAKVRDLYEKLFANGRKTLAQSVARIIQESQSGSSESYLKKPQITIISPQNDIATDSSEISCVVEVHHDKPLQKLFINRRQIYELDEKSIVNPRENISRIFRSRMSVEAGINILRVNASDILDVETNDSLVVYGTNFSLPVLSNTPFSDSLQKSFRIMRSYIPDEVFSPPINNYVRSFVIAGSVKDNQQQSSDRGLMMHSLLTSTLSGVCLPSDAKCLLQDRSTSDALSIILEKWIIPNVTFQSTTILYFSGIWKITSAGWNLFDCGGITFDVKPFIEELAAMGSSGIIMMFDGVVNDRDILRDQLTTIVMGTTVPMKAIVFPATDDWPSGLLKLCHAPGNSTNREEDPLEVTADDVAKFVEGSFLVSNTQRKIIIFGNPGQHIKNAYSVMLGKLAKKLKNENIGTTEKKIILNFCQDWRRYNEVERYLANRLTMSEFLARIDEYNKRTSGGVNE
jgi:hypothetical protein